MDYEKPDVVSIWAGKLQRREVLDHLLAESEEGTSQWAQHLGLEWIDHDFVESYFTGRFVPVPELIGSFSYGDSFVDAAAEAAVRLRVTEVNTALLMYDFDYNQLPRHEPPAGLTFLGVFNYRKTANARFSIPP